MNLVIAGAGEVGTHLAELLSKEDQDITVIDRDGEKLDAIDQKFNILTLTGSPVSFNVLRQARVQHCDLFIAVTPYESENVMACSMAKQLGAARTLARIDNYGLMAPENTQTMRHMGIDSVIYPEYLAAEEIISALRRTWARNWFELHDGQLIVAGVRIRPDAPICGMRLMDFVKAGHHFHVSAIRRAGEVLIPGGSHDIQAGDILYLATTPENMGELLEISGQLPHRVRRIMIMGGGKIARRLCKMIGDEYKVKILDTDMNVCRRLPEKCPNAEIINADGRDVDTLIEEGIDETDAFIALTDSSETNILACMTAKELGVKCLIAEVENMHFVSIAENLEMGRLINKKLLASSTIFQLLLDRDASTNKCLALQGAEVAELEAREGSKITSAPVMKLHLDKNVTLAGLIRHGQGQTINGRTQIQPGDRVVVFSLPGSLKKIEKLFS